MKSFKVWLWPWLTRSRRSTGTSRSSKLSRSRSPGPESWRISPWPAPPGDKIMFTVINMWNTVLIIIIRILYFKLVSNRQGHRVGTGLWLSYGVENDIIYWFCPQHIHRFLWMDYKLTRIMTLLSQCLVLTLTMCWLEVFKCLIHVCPYSSEARGG